MLAAKLSPADAFETDRPSLAVSSQPAQGVTTRPRLVKTYDYLDASGQLVYQVCRFEPKDFRPRRRVGNEWAWNLTGVEPILYRLPDVLEAVENGRRIFLVEGEKDADALAEEGYPATTVNGGAKNWRAKHAETLAKSEIVILPDNDDAGRSYAEQAAADLHAAGCTVRVVPLPELPPKGDVSDWFAAGHSVDELETLIGKSPRWSPDGGQRRSLWRLDELLENDDVMRPPPPVVPYLAWSSRSTLLAAREKSGKSTLTGYIAAQVSRGGIFLDEPCERGMVLVIGLEEFIGDAARRLRDFDADPARTFVADALRATGMDDRLTEINAMIDTVRPSLVILDSLIAFSDGAITDANSSAQTHAVVNGLTRLAHETGVALIIIHHARKSDGKYRDSTAIGGAVDVIAEIFPPDEAADPTRRRVRPVGRVPSRGVDFTFDGRMYHRLDASGPTKAPVEQRILDVVRERPGITANDIAEAIHENRKVVLDRVRLMSHNGQLINDGTATHYRLRLPTFPKSPGLL
jgi:hypothetical protein